MTTQETCWDENPNANLVLEARRIILWAGQLTNAGEEIGGIGAQLNRAAELLQLHHGIVWRAYQRRSGPEIFPTILEARNALLERMATANRKATITYLDDALDRRPTYLHRPRRQRVSYRRAINQ